MYGKVTDDWFSRELQFWHSLLNDTDKQRFSSIKSHKKQQLFLLGRALLHIGCKQLTQVFPNCYHNPSYQQVQFDKLMFQKSVTHSGDAAFVVLSKDVGFRLGVDLESITDRDVREIAELYFNDAEVGILAGLDYSTRHFYQLWTAKEAFIKATSGTMFDTLKLDFSPLLLHKDLQSPGFCHQFYFYYHELEGKALTILSERENRFFNAATNFVRGLN